MQDFPMCSFLIKLFLSLCNAFVLLLIMSVDRVGSNTGSLSINGNGVFTSRRNNDWLGVKRWLFWRGFLTLTFHAKVTSGPQETFQSVTKNITQNFIVFSPAVVLVSILSFFAHLLNISFKNLPPLLVKSCLGNPKYAIHFLYICLIISSSIFV